MDKDKRLSVFLSLVLRHKPEAVGIQLDAHGWADVSALLAGIAQTGRAITLETLEDIVAKDHKQRYSFNENHTKIRANQGHSIPVDVGLQPATPPRFLYHGTATRFLDSIHAEGITRQTRQYVHLSPDIATAQKVGARHGKCIVLTVRAEEMHQAGHSFWLSENNVWLCQHVPTQFIDFYTCGLYGEAAHFAAASFS